MSSIFHALTSWWMQLINPSPIAEINIAAVMRSRQKEEALLRAFYNTVDSPEVLFRTFYARVSLFGWSTTEALIPTRKTITIIVAGREYEIKEFYECCKYPAVTYSAYYNRVVIRGWCPLKAVNTPNIC